MPSGGRKVPEKVTAMEHTGFPSDETLAAFIDGRLDPETRGKVIAHMTACSECYSVFVSATDVTAVAASPGALLHSSRRAWLTVAISAVAAAVAIVFLVTPVRDFVLPHGNRGMAALASAAPDQRIVAGRISGFPYQPLAPVVRGAKIAPMQNTANAKLLTAAADVQRSATERRTIANLHALGVANLLLGNGDTAIDTMHEALLNETGQQNVTNAIKESNDIPLLNDLSVALSHRAASQRKLADAVEAVRCADRAWRIGRTQEAAWNRAVAIEALNGRSGAKTAWHDYLAIDPGSAWAAEARKKLAS